MKCPICLGLCRPTGENYSLREVFESWLALGYPFSENVMKEYAGATILRLHQCGQCGFGFFDPTILGTREFYDELSRTGSSWYYLEDKWEYQCALDDLPLGERVIDIGCGPGFFLERCRKRGLIAEGVELNPTAAAIARAKGFVVHEVLLGALSRTHRDAYDVVSMFQVLEHVEDPASTVADALACLRPGGLLIIGVPNAEGILGRMSQLPANVPPHHVTRWTPKSLAELARRFGLEFLSMKFEPCYRMLPAYFHERVFAWLPGSIRRNRLWRFVLYLPSRILSVLRPRGLDSLTGHTVYCALRKGHAA